MLRHITPDRIRRPFARYSHAVEIAAGSRVVICSGQLGIAPNESIPATIDGQTERCFDNIAAILADCEMSLSDIVRINAYVSGREHLAGYMRVRDRIVGDPPPAS